MMAVRYFALILGIMFLVIGVAGFIPGLTTQHGEAHAADAGLRVTGPGHGYLLGLFHVNVLHNIVHLAFGVYGVIAYRRYDAARVYARVVAIGYGLMTIMGIIPNETINTFFGLVPIHGHDVWLHALLALAGAYFGWVPVRAASPAGTTATVPAGGTTTTRDY